MSARVVTTTSAREGAHVAEMQRRRLMLAFGELLGEVGLDGASVGRICKRAGVSRRTFYEQFEDREDCFLAAFQNATQTVSAELSQASKTTDSWSDRVRAGLLILLESFDQNPGFARMCLVESLRGTEPIVQMRACLFDVLARAVDEGRRQVRATEPPLLTAQGIVGGVQAVLQSRLLQRDIPEFAGLLGSLMGMVVYPYLGSSAARRELKLCEVPKPRRAYAGRTDPFKDLPIRFTYRTARVLEMIASSPGASNRAIAGSAGIADEGQISRLLRRLQACELIVNRSAGQLKGEPNAWALTERGQAIHQAISAQALAPT